VLGVGSSSDDTTHRLVGSATDALGWIERSTVSERDRQALRRLVERFPTLTFYRDDATRLDRAERDNKVTLPPWLRAARQVLAGPMPDVRLRFDDFEHLGPRSDNVADDGFLDLDYDDHFGYVNDEQRGLFLRAGCFTIFAATDSVLNVLAARLGAGEEGIVEYCDEDLMDNEYDGLPGADSVTARSTHTRRCSDTSSSAACRTVPSSPPSRAHHGESPRGKRSGWAGKDGCER
jgi:hypothetical protein